MVVSGIKLLRFEKLAHVEFTNRVPITDSKGSLYENTAFEYEKPITTRGHKITRKTAKGYKMRFALLMIIFFGVRS